MGYKQLRGLAVGKCDGSRRSTKVMCRRHQFGRATGIAGDLLSTRGLRTTEWAHERGSWIASHLAQLAITDETVGAVRIASSEATS
jgi:hypothetical protein